jgi:hypothetical protein
MATNIQELGELAQVLCNNEKTTEGVLSFFERFKISGLIKPFELAKSKGFRLKGLIVTLCLYRLHGLSIWAMQKTKCSFLSMADDNTFYRLLNNPRIDWRKLLMGFAKEFINIVSEKGDNQGSMKCFVIDDTDIEKTGKTFEFIGRIFNHVTQQYILGFKVLALCYWDGKSLITADFSLHREKGSKMNFGITAKERKAQFRKKRDIKTPSYKRVQELDQKKNATAVSMVKRAVKNGLRATYVLMDSWFVSDYIIKEIRSIKDGMLHVLGMCKMDNRKYGTNGMEINSAQIISRYSRKKGQYSRKHKSHYICIIADYKGQKVKLFYVKYQNAKVWNLLLTTDLTLKFVQAIEIYQLRWTIEVLFKECKQYLRLGKSQNTDFDGQIADASLMFITHTILTLQRRFEAYETMGALFRETQQLILELTLFERILKTFLKMLQQLLELIGIDIEETMEKILHDEKTNRHIAIMLNALQESSNSSTDIVKMVA